jgi:hypothetical protein
MAAKPPGIGWLGDESICGGGALLLGLKVELEDNRYRELDMGLKGGGRVKNRFRSGDVG